MPTDLIVQSFNAGELTPLVDGRSDLEKYYLGCRLLENMIPTRYGPAERRPGTYFVTEIKDSSKKAKLIPFQYSTEQAYMLEFGDEYIRFLMDRGQIITGGGTEDLSSLDNIVAHWLLNDNLGNTDVLDDDGNDHDGIATANTNTLHATAPGGTGCFDLDGQYAVEIADSDLLSFDDSGDNPFSMACWANVSESGDIQALLSKWKEDTAREWRFSLNNERKLQLHLSDDSVNLEGNRVAQWYLNDDAATTHCDDVSTNHDGVIANAVNSEDITATGKIGKCFDFDTQYAVEVNDADTLSFDDSGDNPFSIAAWIYVVPTYSDQHILSKWDASTDREWDFFLKAKTAPTYLPKLAMYLFDETADQTIYSITDNVLSAGWHFVCMTYDSTGGATAADGIKLYVDGALVDSTVYNTVYYVQMRNTDAKVAIGAFYISSGLRDYFSGKIDNVVLFDKELTTANVLNLYNSGNGTESLATAFPNAMSDDAIGLGWHFLCATYDSTGGATAADGIKLYVDGALVDSTATNEANYVAMENTAIKVRIGSQYSAAAANEKFWGDKIDNVALFSDVLTATEIADLYSTVPYEISSPYLEADLFGLQQAQSADVLYNVHGSYPQSKLMRYAHAWWELEDIVFDWPSFLDVNNTDITITPSGTIGTIDLTASSSIFTSDHVGSYWLIKHPRTNNKISADITSDYSAYAATGISDILVDVKGPFRIKTSGTWTGTIEVERSYDKQLTLVLDSAPASGAWSADDIITGATSGDTCIIVSVVDSTHYTIKQLSGSFTDGEILSNQSANSRDCAATWPRYEGWHTMETPRSTGDQNFNITGNEEVGNGYLRVKCTSYTDQINVVLSCERFYHEGIVRITGFANATTVTATVIRTTGSTDATKLWSEGAWSDERGYPVTVSFYEGRIWFAGTTHRPLDVWSSRVQDYENLQIGTLDDDAVKYTVDSSMQNMIRWLVGQEVLLIGTSGGEWKLGSSDPADAITPTNPMRPRIQTTYGSKEIQALLLANAILFVDAQGKRVRGAQYIFEKGEAGSYDAPDYTLLAEHITESGIVGMAYQQNPHPILWCWRDDGKMIGMVFEPGQKVWGWFPLNIDGEVESVAVEPGTPEDTIWIIVNRTINGATKRYIEYFKPRDWGSDQADCFFVDSGLTFDGGDAVTITGITEANPGVVTAAAHGFSDGDQVKIIGVAGMTEVNNKVFTVDSPATNTFSLRDKLDTVNWDTMGHTAFASSITGDVEWDSYTITNVSAADIAKLAYGTTVTGTGIPSSTTITAIGDDSFTMSNKGMQTTTSVTITAQGTVMQVDNSFSGLDHLEGKTVSVLGDGSVHTDVVVSSGAITLTDYFNKVHVGLPYRSKLMPMKLASPNANIRGKVKRIPQIIFSFYKTLGCEFGTTEGSEVIPFRKTTDPMGSPPPLFTGEKQQTFPGGYELNGDIFVEQNQPLPLTVRSITPHLSIYGA